MAERRMFAKTIIDSDAFLEMPMSARLLYYDLGMRADDDGFVNSPKKIMKIIGATNDDMNILIMRKFIIPFDNGVVVIKHWRINNYLRKDRYNETQYIEQKSMLDIDEKGNYHLQDTVGIPNGLPTVDTGKDRLGKDIYTITNVIVSPSEERDDESNKHKKIVDAWNDLSSYGIKPIRNIAKGSNRETQLMARIRQYGEDSIFEAIENIKKSSFLQGKNKRDWTIVFDWFIKPTNFPKVLEGNYNDNLPTKVSNSDTGQIEYGWK